MGQKTSRWHRAWKPTQKEGACLQRQWRGHAVRSLRVPANQESEHRVDRPTQGSELQ